MSKIAKIIRENLFLTVVVLGYIALFIVWPGTGVTAAGNSVYYIKEMLSIMPVIFVLTALLDVWVPRQTIIMMLGSGSGIRGLVFSFILGGISAGPIYAAFPFCVMLHRKGASIRNIVVILSSWAVIKAPMLLNEVKFLSAQFMATRWVLTVIAILIFSWITAKIVRDEDLPREETQSKKIGISVNGDACLGCALCTRSCPELFVMQGKKAVVRETDCTIDEELLRNAIESCPVGAIDLFGKRTKSKLAKAIGYKWPFPHVKRGCQREDLLKPSSLWNLSSCEIAQASAEACLPAAADAISGREPVFPP